MKFIIIILVNILFISCTIIGIDYLAWKSDVTKNIKHHNKIILENANKNNTKPIGLRNISDYKYSIKLNHFKKIYELYEPYESLWRVIRRNSKKGSIIVFGCSFAEGAFLEPTENFEYKLSELTNRTVYNRGFSGFGLSPMVWMTKQDKFFKKIDIVPEYAIYIYIFDHQRRLIEEKYGTNDMKTYVGFTPENGILIEKYSLSQKIGGLFIWRNFLENVLYYKILSTENQDKNFDLLKLHFEEARRELKKHYPNIKFIIIKHPYGIIDDYIEGEKEYKIFYSYKTDRWKELEENGFIIYDLKDKIPEDLRKSEYTFPDGHPNEKAWDIVTKKLVQDLHL